MKKNLKIVGPKRLMREWKDLISEIALMPKEIQKMANLGLKKVVDFQNTKYGREYIKLLKEIISQDSANKSYSLSIQSAKAHCQCNGL